MSLITRINTSGYTGMLRYLESGKDMEDGFWISILSSNNEYPHAPWWTKTEKKRLMSICRMQIYAGSF